MECCGISVCRCVHHFYVKHLGSGFNCQASVDPCTTVPLASSKSVGSVWIARAKLLNCISAFHNKWTLSPVDVHPLFGRVRG